MIVKIGYFSTALTWWPLMGFLHAKPSESITYKMNEILRTRSVSNNVIYHAMKNRTRDIKSTKFCDSFIDSTFTRVSQLSEVSYSFNTVHGILARKSRFAIQLSSYKLNVDINTQKICYRSFITVYYCLWGCGKTNDQENVNSKLFGSTEEKSKHYRVISGYATSF